MDHLISWQWISKTNCKSMNVLVPPLPPRFLPIRPPGAAHEEALETESDSKLCWPWQHKGQLGTADRFDTEVSEYVRSIYLLLAESWVIKCSRCGRSGAVTRREWERRGATPSLRVTSCCCCFTHPAPTRDDFTDPTEAGHLWFIKGNNDHQWIVIPPKNKGSCLHSDNTVLHIVWFNSYMK